MRRSLSKSAKKPRPPRSDEQQRRENGGYTDAELDDALLRSQRSDPISVGTGLLFIGIVYAFMARAIVEGLQTPYLLLPLIAELLAALAIGWVMARTVVTCPAFRRSARSTLAVLFCAALITLPVLAWLAYDPEPGQLSIDRIPAAANDAWLMTIESGLGWAIVGGALGLALRSALEVQAWRRQGGVFFWASMSSMGTRLGLVIVVAVFAAVPMLFFGPFLFEKLGKIDGLANHLRESWVWPVWGALLLLDLGVVVVQALMHRDLLRKHATSENAASL